MRAVILIAAVACALAPVVAAAQSSPLRVTISPRGRALDTTNVYPHDGGRLPRVTVHVAGQNGAPAGGRVVRLHCETERWVSCTNEISRGGAPRWTDRTATTDAAGEAVFPSIFRCENLTAFIESQTVRQGIRPEEWGPGRTHTSPITLTATVEGTPARAEEHSTYTFLGSQPYDQNC